MWNSFIFILENAFENASAKWRLFGLGLNELILPGQNSRHFADDIFRCISVKEKFCILIKISLKFVLNGLIDNNPALV